MSTGPVVFTEQIVSPELFDSLERTHHESLRMVFERLVYDLNEVMEENIDFGKHILIRVTAEECEIDRVADE